MYVVKDLVPDMNNFYQQYRWVQYKIQTTESLLLCVVNYINLGIPPIITSFPHFLCFTFRNIFCNRGFPQSYVNLLYCKQDGEVVFV